MAVLTPIPKMQFVNVAGEPLVNGKLYTYAAGTTTPQSTYTDSTGATANSNPVILDTRGEASIWLGGSAYKFILTDSDDNEIWSVDYISAPSTALSPVFTGNVTIDTSSGGPALRITQTGSGNVLTVQDSADPDTTPFVIDSTGRVGIGTGTPNEALEINDGTVQVSNSGTPRSKWYADAAQTTFTAEGARNLVLRVNNVDQATITDSGATFAGAVTASSFTGAWANIPSGTVMLFAQTTAPTGWTKSTTHNNKALRVVSGSASSGGTVDFTTAFASQAVSGTVGNHTLTANEIPQHTHSATSTLNEGSGHRHGVFVSQVSVSQTTNDVSVYQYNATPSVDTGYATTNASVSTTVGNNTTTGSGHNHTFTGTAINLAVAYVDVIIATKN